PFMAPFTHVRTFLAAVGYCPLNGAIHANAPWDIQHNDCVSSPHSNFPCAAEIPVNYPRIAFDQLLDLGFPFVLRCRVPIRPPEMCIKVNDRKSRDIAEATRERGLSGSSGTNYDHLFHF